MRDFKYFSASGALPEVCMMLASDTVGSTWAMVKGIEVFFAARIISSAFENEVSALAVRLRDKAHMP